jgi:hypothetical protein
VLAGVGYDIVGKEPLQLCLLEGLLAFENGILICIDTHIWHFINLRKEEVMSKINNNNVQTASTAIINTAPNARDLVEFLTVLDEERELVDTLEELEDALKIIKGMLADAREHNNDGLVADLYEVHSVVENTIHLIRTGAGV